MDQEQMQRCLDVVAAYPASGHKGKAWAQANGVPERSLANWCAHAWRWQARLDGVNYAPNSQPCSFVAAHLVPDAASLATVRMQMRCGAVAPCGSICTGRWPIPLSWPARCSRCGSSAQLLHQAG